jgi:predicted phage tail component-like protein
LINEIFFNNKGSYTDFDGILTYFKPQPPAPKIIKSAVPYMNGSYDFSNLYGDTTYNERKIPCKLQFVTKNRNLLYIKYTKVLEWLLGGGKAKLTYATEPGLYYMARVESAPTFETFVICGIFEFDFIAYPFKYGENTEGADIWDDFNFETDYAQKTKFDVTGSKTIELYNLSSIKITPTVICNSNFSVVKSGVTYNFVTGTTNDFRFGLEKGLNNLTINGTGNIEFVIRKEVF